MSESTGGRPSTGQSPVELSTTSSDGAGDAPEDRLSLEPESAQLAEFSLTSDRGNERLAMNRIASIADILDLDEERLERLKTAVAEATLNAIEHGNRFSPEKLVFVEVIASPTAITVRITDQGSGGPISAPVAPDLDAKLAGKQSPRGWGLFLIQNMVDEMRIGGDEHHHTVELTINRD